MFGLANRDLPTALLPLPILNVILVGSEPIVQPRVQMYSSWGDKCPFSVFPLMYRRLSLWGPSGVQDAVVQLKVVLSAMEIQDLKLRARLHLYC